MIRFHRFLLPLAAVVASFTVNAGAQATDRMFPSPGITSLQTAINTATDVNNDGVIVVQVAAGIRTARVNITRSNFILRGSGTLATQIQFTTSGTLPVIRVTNASNVVIENLKVRSNNREIGGNGISIQGGTGNIVRNVEVFNATFGIETLGATGVLVENVLSRNNVLDGVAILESESVTVRNSTVRNNFENGLIVEGSSNVLVENILANANEVSGIRTVGSVDSRILNNIMSNGNGEGLRLREDDNLVADGNQMINNQGFGVRIRATDTDFNATVLGTQAAVGNNTVTGNVEGVLRVD